MSKQRRECAATLEDTQDRQEARFLSLPGWNWEGQPRRSCTRGSLQGLKEVVAGEDRQPLQPRCGLR